MKKQVSLITLALCTQAAMAQDTGVIIAGEGDCKRSDRIVIETRRGFTLAETYRGSFSKGDKVLGELNRFGFKDVDIRGRKGRIYIDNWGEGERKAMKWCTES